MRYGVLKMPNTTGAQRLALCIFDQRLRSASLNEVTRLLRGSVPTKCFPAIYSQSRGRQILSFQHDLPLSAIRRISVQEAGSKRATTPAIHTKPCCGARHPAQKAKKGAMNATIDRELPRQIQFKTIVVAATMNNPAATPHRRIVMDATHA
jgi:hypothetical protein